MTLQVGIKVRARQLADDEMMSADALADLAGQRVRGLEVRAATVEDGWLVFTFDAPGA